MNPTRFAISPSTCYLELVCAQSRAEHFPSKHSFRSHKLQHLFPQHSQAMFAFIISTIAQALCSRSQPARSCPNARFRTFQLLTRSVSSEEEDQRLWCALEQPTAHLHFGRQYRTQARLHAASTPNRCNQIHRERAQALWSHRLEAVRCSTWSSAFFHVQLHHHNFSLPFSRQLCRHQQQEQPSIRVCLRHIRSLNTLEPQWRESIEPNVAHYFSHRTQSSLSLSLPLCVRTLTPMEGTKVERWLDNRAGQFFFCWVSFFQPSWFLLLPGSGSRGLKKKPGQVFFERGQFFSLANFFERGQAFLQPGPFFFLAAGSFF